MRISNSTSVAGLRFDLKKNMRLRYSERSGLFLGWQVARNDKKVNIEKMNVALLKKNHPCFSRSLHLKQLMCFLHISERSPGLPGRCSTPTAALQFMKARRPIRRWDVLKAL